MELPISELLSREECRLIAKRSLKDENNTEIIDLLDCQLKRGSSDLVGYMGEYYNLILIVQDKNKLEHRLQYFIKSVPRHNEPHRAECERKGFFRKETTIYTKILPQVQKYATKKLFPRCFYTRSDLIVLEDLQAMEYQHLTGSYTMEHFKLVLDHQAELHAASIAWEQAEKFNIGERFEDSLFEMQLTTQNEWYLTGVQGIVFLALRHAKYQTEKAQKFIAEQLPRVLAEASELTNPSKSIRNVLCHRDTWDRNILFNFKDSDSLTPSSCCFVDFQLTKYCAPTLDVLFMLYIVPPAHLRREIYDDCLDFYFNSLQLHFARLNIAKDVITRLEFEEHCKKARVAALILWAICEPLTKMPEGLANKIRKEEPQIFDYYMNTDRSELFLRIIAKQPDYENVIMAPIEELVDYLLVNGKQK